MSTFDKRPIAIKQQGFMLIEVLVSVLIFSIGVLALIGLQARMTTEQTTAKIRSDAAYLASELIGIAWSDIPNLASYNACAEYAPCKDWQSKVSQNLPGGTSTITADATSGELNVTIQWKQASESQHRYQTTTFIKAAN